MNNHTLQQVIDLAVKTAVLQAKKEAILECRPIGSYFITETDDDPNVIFGGGWKRVKGKILQCSDDKHPAGTDIEAGLPDIEGKATFLNSDGMDDASWPDLGCFSWGVKPHNYVLTLKSGKGKRDLLFKASRSNSIYGKSDTVQPPTHVVNAWIRIS